MSAAPPLVELREIRKAFGGVKAVDGVSVNLYPGEVVALLGQNGAGKSTLKKMPHGAYPVESGAPPVRGAHGVWHWFPRGNQDPNKAYLCLPRR